MRAYRDALFRPLRFPAGNRRQVLPPGRPRPHDGRTSLKQRLAIRMALLPFWLAACATQPTAESPPPQPIGNTPLAAEPQQPQPEDTPRPQPVTTPVQPPTQKSLLGATYVKRVALPKAIGIGWKTAHVIRAGKDGSPDVLVVEKQKTKRVVVARAQKFWGKSLYRYVVKAELDLPPTPADAVVARCSSWQEPGHDFIAILTPGQSTEPLWLGRRAELSLEPVMPPRLAAALACQYRHKGKSIDIILPGSLPDLSDHVATTGNTKGDALPR